MMAEGVGFEPPARSTARGLSPEPVTIAILLDPFAQCSFAQCSVGTFLNKSYPRNQSKHLEYNSFRGSALGSTLAAYNASRHLVATRSNFDFLV